MSHYKAGRSRHSTLRKWMDTSPSRWCFRCRPHCRLSNTCKFPCIIIARQHHPHLCSCAWLTNRCFHLRSPDQKADSACLKKTKTKKARSCHTLFFLGQEKKKRPERYIQVKDRTNKHSPALHLSFLVDGPSTPLKTVCTGPSGCHRRLIHVSQP